MTDTESFPLQRIFCVADLKPEGVEFNVETSAEERKALAAFLDIPAIHSLTGHFRLSGDERQVTVQGHVHAAVEQTCTVSLDPFDDSIHEEIDVLFAAPDTLQQEPVDSDDPESDLNAPDLLINGEIDLGALTAEFLALGLQPYPRKPGVEFTFDDESAETRSPFTALSALKKDNSDNKE